MDAQELEEEYARLCRWRKSWLRRIPIADLSITALDKQLEHHPLLKPKMRWEIKKRSIYLLWLKYMDADPALKQEIKVELRVLYEALTIREQNQLGDLWHRWLDTFEEEEVASGERKDRKYVWSPRSANGTA